ncbi:MAG: CHASE2 domain-containing protein, partial [Bdellovibrionota bacterium]
MPPFGTAIAQSIKKRSCTGNMNIQWSESGMELKAMLKRIKFFEKHIMITGAATALATILTVISFDLLEAKLYDIRTKIGFQIKPDQNITIITLDDATTTSLNEYSPLPLDFHAILMEQLEKLDPRAVGYLIDFGTINQVNPDLFQTKWATRFVDAAMRLQGRGSQVLLGTSYDVTGEVVPPYPLSMLPHSVAVIHKDGNVFSEDKVTRRALVELNDRAVFHIDLARRLGLAPIDRYPRGTFNVPEIDSRYFFFRYHGDTTASSYERVSFLDVLKGNLQPGFLKNKIVLVGTLSKDNWSDFAVTPYSKQPFMNPKLAIHANILDSVIHNHSIVRLPVWIELLTTVAVTVFVMSWVLTSSPLGGLFSTIGLCALFMIFSQLLFQFKGVWLRGSEPLLGILLGYYLTVPYRLIREYEKRWNYQRKNELLT